MFEYPDFDSNNVRLLCEMNGKNAEMNMTIFVKKLFKGEEFSLADENNETAVLLLSGNVEFSWNGETREGKRKNPFEKKALCSSCF